MNMKETFKKVQLELLLRDIRKLRKDEEKLQETINRISEKWDGEIWGDE